MSVFESRSPSAGRTATGAAAVCRVLQSRPAPSKPGGQTPVERREGYFEAAKGVITVPALHTMLYPRVLVATAILKRAVVSQLIPYRALPGLTAILAAAMGVRRSPAEAAPEVSPQNLQQLMVANTGMKHRGRVGVCCRPRSTGGVRLMRSNESRTRLGQTLGTNRVRGHGFETTLKEFFNGNPFVIAIQPLAPGADAQEPFQIMQPGDNPPGEHDDWHGHDDNDEGFDDTLAPVCLLCATQEQSRQPSQLIRPRKGDDDHEADKLQPHDLGSRPRVPHQTSSA